MKPAEIIKARVSIMAACDKYEIDVNYAGFARCPFHIEKTGSFRIYPDGSYHCFGCGKHGGSVIDFVMDLFDLSFQEACEKINSDFKLNIMPGQKRTRSERITDAKADWMRRKEAERIKAEHQKLLQVWDTAIRYLKALEILYECSRPADPYEEWSDAFVYACKELPEARDRADNALEALSEFEVKHQNG